MRRGVAMYPVTKPSNATPSGANDLAVWKGYAIVCHPSCYGMHFIRLALCHNRSLVFRYWWKAPTIERYHES